MVWYEVAVAFLGILGTVLCCMALGAWARGPRVLSESWWTSVGRPIPDSWGNYTLKVPRKKKS